MNQKTEHPQLNSFPEILTDENSIGQLLQARAKSRLALDVLDKQLTGYLNDTAIATALEQAQDSFISAGGQYEDFIHHITSTHTEHIPSAVVDTFATIESLSHEEMGISLALDRGHGKEFNQFVRSQASELLKSVDRIMLERESSIALGAREVNGAMLYDILQSCAKDDGDDTFEHAEFYFDTLEEVRIALNKLNSINDKGDDSVKESEETNYDAEIITTILKRYKGSKKQYVKNAPAWENSLTDTPSERAALEKYLTLLDKEAAIDAISIEGVEKLFSLTGVRQDENILNKLREYPTIALQEIKRILFLEKPSDISEDEKRHLDSELGYHKPNADEADSTIVVWLDKPHKVYEEWAAWNPNFATRMAMSSLFQTLDHEMGHALHTALPVSLLHEWDQLVRSENIDVTGYVAHMQSEEHVHYESEDFADTFGMYLRVPDDLLSIAPKRYEAMKRLYAIVASDRITPLVS